MNIFNKTLVAAFLVGGTCVGGGILALPVEAGGIGFFPVIFVLLFSWAFMMLTGLLYAEASIWMKSEGAHVVTISKCLLGRGGEIIAILLYLFMGYASLVAYNSGGAVLIHNFIKSMLDFELGNVESTIIFAIVFGSILYCGTKILGIVNSCFVIGLVASYIGMVSIGFSGIKRELLSKMNIGETYSILPLMITSFSFQMIVPSLALYLNHDAKALKNSIIFGTTIPLFAYAIWLFVVLGIVPHDGPHGLEESLMQGLAATESLKYFSFSSYLVTFAEYFAFFALVTSYLGIALGLYDFLADLTGIIKQSYGKFLLGLLVFLPTLCFSIIYKNAFIFALDITGGFGDSILNGILPVLMVWIGRYVIGYDNCGLRLFGGKILLVLIFLCSLLILVAQTLKFIL